MKYGIGYFECVWVRVGNGYISKTAGNFIKTSEVFEGTLEDGRQYCQRLKEKHSGEIRNGEKHLDFMLFELS